MFGEKKAQENRFIIAVKNYEETFESIKEGTLRLPYDKSIYLKLLASQSSKVDNLKDLGKFIRENGKAKKEVMHYWEGLITDGYTLLNVEYTEKIPAIGHVCNSEKIKYVCPA